MSWSGWLGLGFALFVLFVAVVVGPPIMHSVEVPERTATGKVSHFGWSESSRDIQIRLEGDSTHYYLNRGLDMGIDGPKWKSALLGQPLTLEVVHRNFGLMKWADVGPIRGVIWSGDTLYRTGVVTDGVLDSLPG